ncbi:PQQ-binding-like beta-propeller repeat protein [Candidatus Pelagibacter sp. Uisw_134_02]|uniref:PQQ-binding-like beta-propeller repeat protein n=1 Tax=Candidatus Pelagibacter sp. Uisw_134_02 TaxID=3230990 RepID=UPI0039E9EB60
MNNILKILLIFLFITGCSFHKNSKFWSKEKIVEEKQKNITELFKKDAALSLEFNPDLKIKLNSRMVNNSFLNNHHNNDGRINYNGNLKSISKYKFKKIKDIYQYEPEITFNQSNIIFFDNEGSILNFDNNSDLIWKKNYYSKSEKKQNPVLFFGHNENILIIADNIAKLYAVNINTGKLLWKKKNEAPFNSQVKIYKDKFYVVDFENTLRAYSVKDGKEIWNNKTKSSLIRSQKRLSMVISNKVIYFNNSLGDISAIDIDSGKLLWQTPTQSSLAYDTGFYLKTSDIVAKDDTLFFSNNQNQFFSLDMQTGNLNWKQEINSNLRPIIINEFIFTVSLEGYLIVLEKNNGNIIRVNDVFKNFKAKNRSKIKPTGFIIGSKNIYLSTNNGRLLVIDINSGQTQIKLKIDKKKISRASVFNKNLYVITDNSIIKLN